MKKISRKKKISNKKPKLQINDRILNNTQENENNKIDINQNGFENLQKDIFKEYDDYTYGQKIIKNKTKKLTEDMLESKVEPTQFNPQKELVNRMQTEPDDTLLANAEPYWNNLNIEQITERSYDNNQISAINEIKNNSKEQLGKSISEVYDKLTNSQSNYTNNVVENKINTFDNLQHHDENVLPKMNEIYGSNNDCNFLELQ